MTSNSALLSDPDRLAALRQTLLLDSPVEETFDRITQLVAKLLGAPVALLSLVEMDRQFFKSCVGLPAPLNSQRETPLTHSFCQHVVTSGKIFRVEDARIHPLVHNNLAVTDWKAVSYLGAPLAAPGGHCIGALCAIDGIPRQWTIDQEKMLSDLASFVVAEIGSRAAVESGRLAQLALKEAAEQLRQQEAETRFEAQFHFLADTMPQIVWTSRSDGSIVDYYNQRWFDYTGLTFEQTRDRCWERVLHPDDIQGCLTTWATCNASGETFEREIRLRQASDGSYRWHLARSVAMRDADGSILRWVGTSTDVHDRKTTGDALKQSHDSLEQRVHARTAELSEQKQFLQAVLENVSDGIIACDATGKITCLNRTLRRMQKIDRVPESITTEWATEKLALHDPRTGQRMEWRDRPLDRALRNDPVDALEAIINADPLNPVTIVASSKALIDEQGNILGAVAAWHDVTELRRYEKELLSAKDAADAANLAKSEFLANMSHEIRTPMTAIMGYTDLLDDPTQSPRQRTLHLNVIRRNGEHLLQLLSDILDLSKIEAGEMKVELVECSPAEVMNEVETLMRPRAVAKQISLTTRLQCLSSAGVLTDPTRLKQILLNLVGNAIKFTERGGVVIDARLSDVNDGSACLQFEVSDTGIGMNPAQQGQLFRPFRQADGSTTRKFGGTGLGLAICKRLAHILNGELIVLSTEGVGSTFTLVLPVKLAAPSAIAPKTNGKVSCQSSVPNLRLSGRILVADDGIDNQRLVRLYLEAAGLAVETADNGKIAVDRVIDADQTGNPFDAVLMDMQMPELDGYDATAQLRAAGFTCLPIIAFTAHALSNERDTCIASGCTDYVTKPIDRKHLIEVLGKYLPAVSTSDHSLLRSDKATDPLISTVLHHYIEGLPGQISKISQHLVSTDLRALRLIVHQLKGSGGSYGFPEITTRAGNAETAIAGKEPIDRIASEVQSLVEVIRRVEGYDRNRENDTTADCTSSDMSA